MINIEHLKLIDSAGLELLLWLADEVADRGGRLKLVNPPADTIEKGPEGLLRVAGGEPAEPDAAVSVVNGALESSNVNPVEALVNMIELSRLFEMNIKAMNAAKENDAASASLLRLS